MKTTEQPAKSTLQKLSPIPNVPGLYRHENGSYYGKKKIRGNRKVHALTFASGENIKDRKLAEVALAKWKAELTAPKPATMLFSELWAKWETNHDGKSEGTKRVIKDVKRGIEMDFPEVFKMAISAIKPSHLSEFFARRSKKLGHYAFNEMSRQIKGAFEIAVNDGLLNESPYAKIPKNMRRKKIKREPAKVPTIEQCEAICDHVRNQQFSDTAEASADMLELMHRAALGTAECIFADWSRVEWEKGYMETKRIKTGAWFRVPLYPHFKPFLSELWERQGKPKAGKLISIKSPKQALYNACKRLGYEAYSPIDFRKARITAMLWKGIPSEQIAKWEGHKDNGELIRKTYSWVITALDDKREQEHLAKLAS